MTIFILYLAAVNTTWLSHSTDKSLQQGHILGLLNVVLILSATNNNFEKLLFTLELLQIDSQKSLLIAIFFEQIKLAAWKVLLIHQWNRMLVQTKGHLCVCSIYIYYV